MFETRLGGKTCGVWVSGQCGVCRTRRSRGGGQPRGTRVVGIAETRGDAFASENPSRDFVGLDADGDRVWTPSRPPRSPRYVASEAKVQVRTSW